MFFTDLVRNLIEIDNRNLVETVEISNCENISFANEQPSPDIIERWKDAIYDYRYSAYRYHHDIVQVLLKNEHEADFFSEDLLELIFSAFINVKVVKITNCNVFSFCKNYEKYQVPHSLNSLILKDNNHSFLSYLRLSKLPFHGTTDILGENCWELEAADYKDFEKEELEPTDTIWSEFDLSAMILKLVIN